VFKRFYIFFLIFGFVIVASSSFSQSNLSLKYFGLTVHPFGDYSASIQPNKLDKNAFFVLNFGGYASYEKFVWYDFISIKLKQGIFTDCSAGMMGVSHFGAQLKLLENQKNRLSFGIGPTFIYRESWKRFEVYEDSGFWKTYTSKKYGEIQYTFIPYGCEFEYDYKLSDKTDLSVDFTPGFPFAFTFSVGIKHWLTKDFKKRVKLVVPKNKKAKVPQ